VRFRELDVAGAFVIEPDRHGDDRGWFARFFATEEFAAHGIGMDVVHVNASFNEQAGTLRGMHLQAEPHAEAKVIRVTRGAAHDVLVDVRPQSPTFRRWAAVELRPDDARAVYAPEGVAHGFITLEDSTELLYLMSAPYVAEAAGGVRWDDPAFGIDWPREPVVISDRDASWPDLAL
jgi:dTDP-4-dehydrorhamnose 3,5-epimerase